jgi:hypothetical protein
MGYRVGVGYVLWATAQDLNMSYRPYLQANYHSTELHNSILNDARSLKKTVVQKCM